MWWRIGIGALLLGHAFVHAVWRTYGPKASWLLPQASEASLRSLSTMLFVIAAVGFALASLAVFLSMGWWRVLTVLSSGVSLVLLVLFWNRGLIVGAALDVAFLVALLWFHWPQAATMGP